ncbi:hypothetical protein Aph02nite_79180 [Actinoplanes philippinensis]|uniref:Uncharacterized protein n=1 Tax=Actinoplanes philippinensis TaxID=35752 RepID=A0A1I2KJ04_9ACTN|nr:hypothetical protein [Actinoplanes philippinensis]GIE81968.1 hypothetical protein Aph02nite_79180 [Actinoplanes philippinensis]SFF65071.1 hypothetical protein SAMN05421541_116146 [Actinoplanes philippinensis]
MTEPLPPRSPRSTNRAAAVLLAGLLLTACHKPPHAEVPPPHGRAPLPAPAHQVDDLGEAGSRAGAVNAEARRLASSRTRETVTLACMINDTYANVTEEDVAGLINQAGGYAGVRASAVYALLSDLEQAESSGDAIRAAAVAALCESAQTTR